MVAALVPEPSSNASRPRRYLVAGLVSGLLIAGCTRTLQPATGVDPPTQIEARVEWVIDGDTIDLVIDDQSERVRLIGIDTPESVSRTTPVQCYGKEASDALTGLIPPGTVVRVVRDEEARDRYGRLLLYVYRASDDLFVNRWLVEQGFADTLFFAPNDTYENEFLTLRNDARSEERGLWSSCDGPDQPLE